MTVAALTGTLVVTLEQAVAAPYCSRLLAEGGARVIKLERPDGDFARYYDDVIMGDSGYFVWLNAGKESLVVDLKRASDVALVRNMLTRADVYIQNLRPGAVDRLGLGYADVSTHNPGLVMCSISGYGLEGEYAQAKAYDALIQAESGVCSITGRPDEPAKVGASICDISTGLSAYGEILKALLAKGASGKGQHIDVSLFEVMAEWMAVPMAYYEYGGKLLTGTGMDHGMIAPYGTFRAADGPIFIVVQNHREWLALCSTVLERPQLATDPRFETNALRMENKDALRAQIETNFSRFTRAEMSAKLDRGNIAHGNINSVREALQHPALRTKTVVTSGHEARLAKRVGDSGATTEVPGLNQHGDNLRSEFSD